MAMRNKLAGVLMGVLVGAGPAAAEDSALVSYKTLSPEVAMELAQATLAACRKSGFQVAVAVVDRAGVPLAMVRDRYAGSHTPDTATRKAWTAASFRTDTMALSDMTQAGKPQSGVREVTNALMIGGGVPVEAAGSLVGAVGVSGAPGGEQDDACARTGIEAIEDRLAF